MILQVGTAVVTRGDGRLALGRLGSLCEQVCNLMAQEYNFNFFLCIDFIVSMEEYNTLIL